MKQLILIVSLLTIANSYSIDLDSVFSGSVTSQCKGKPINLVICDATVYPIDKCSNMVVGKQSYRLTPNKYKTLKSMGYTFNAINGTSKQCAAILASVEQKKIAKRIKRLKNKGL